MIVSNEFLILLAGLLLSLFTFSLILGDNWLFRFAASVLSGLLSGYVCILLIDKILITKMIEPFSDLSDNWNEKIVIILVILSGVFLFLKFYFQKKTGGNLILATLLCIAAALTISGIANGTILGFYQGIISRFQLVENHEGIRYWAETGIILIGTITSLLYTQHYWFNRKDQTVVDQKISLHFFSSIGEIFIGIALGSIFAGCFVASAMILVQYLSRIISTSQFLLQWVK